MAALARTSTTDPDLSLSPARDAQARATTKILGRAVRSPALRFGEALGLPAGWLPSLPAAPTLVLRVAGVPGRVVVALAPEAARAARAAGDVAFHADEWTALARATEADRVWPADFVDLCARKRAEGGLELTLEAALAGAQPDPREHWTAAQVLERIGAEVVAIEV